MYLHCTQHIRDNIGLAIWLTFFSIDALKAKEVTVVVAN